MRKLIFVLPLLVVIMAGCGHREKELPTDVRFLQELATQSMGSSLVWKDIVSKPPTLKQFTDPKWRMLHRYDLWVPGPSIYRNIWKTTLSDGSQVRAYVKVGSGMVKKVDYFDQNGNLVSSWSWETERYRLQLERLTNGILSTTDMVSVEKGIRTLEMIR